MTASNLTYEWMVSDTAKVLEDVPTRFYLGHLIQYVDCELKPHFPVPAIPLEVRYCYVGCVVIDDTTNPDDPVIVLGYDSWNRINF